MFTACVEVRGQLMGVYSLSPLWVPGIEIRLSGLTAASILNYCAISTALSLVCFFGFVSVFVLETHCNPSWPGTHMC